MIDSRRCPNCTATRSSSWLHVPIASGPRCAIRSLMTSTRLQPSACWYDPAIPHTSGSCPLSSTAVAEEPPVDVEICALLMAPGQLLLDPRAPHLAHPRPSGLVVHEVNDGRGIVGDVVGPDVNRSVGGRNARLAQVERHDGKPERHVLHRLVHCRHVIQRILGVRRQAYVCRGQYPRDQLIGRPPGELDMARQAQLVAQCDQVVEAITLTNQREGDVVAAKLMYHDF